MSDDSDPNPIPLSEPAAQSELRHALSEGDPQRVRDHIGAGADIHYKREEGYDALVDAVHGRDVQGDPRLLELLALLVESRVDLSGVTSYGESGLRVLSRLGRFDAVRLLLNAGADRSQLEWSPLIEAVALGSVADVRSVLANGAALEDRDYWSRTSLLIAIQLGEIEKAKFLRESGADLTACGRCGEPPLFYAIEGHHLDVLRWLLNEGMDVHQTDEFGTTSLIEAVGADDIECVEILLQAGADVAVNSNGTALSGARSRAIVLRLLDAGADPADISSSGQRVVLGLSDVGEDALAAVSPEDFRQSFTRSFGQSNPERMDIPFWKAMIRSGGSACRPRRRFEEKGLTLREPVWCADRFGQSLTLLPDGRALQIGGEHEDGYDQDFCIYNDVFVYEGDGSVAIYGYPEAEFPPTDSHTATLIGDYVYVIGSLGYMGTRRYGETPVYRLDVHTLRIDRLDVGGEAPGWLFKHRAIAVDPHGIRVWAGTVAKGGDNEELHEPNVGTFLLELDRMKWRRE